MNFSALFLLNDLAGKLASGPAERAKLDQLLGWVAPRQNTTTYRDLGTEAASVEIILSGWGMPVVDEDFLRQFRSLRIIFYAAGSIRPFMTDAAWDRGVRAASAAKANAIPVSEFTFAQIILCLKGVWRRAHEARASRCFDKRIDWPTAGAYGSTVGLISLGLIGRIVAEKLRTLSVEVIAYDPHIGASAASELGVRLCGLDELFATADVVSCHAPALPSTFGMIQGRHFEQMKPGASFINTARGSVVAEEE